MTISADLSGRLDINVTYAGGVIQKVYIRSTRPLSVCQVLEGKHAEEAVALVPLLFSLCSSAQSLAAVTAVESLRGETVSDQVIAARSFLLLAETARELGIRLARDWMPGTDVIAVTDLIKWYQNVQQDLAWVKQTRAEEIDPGKVFGFYISELELILKVVLGGNNLNFKESIYAENRHPLGQAMENLNQRFCDIALNEGAPGITWDGQILARKLAENSGFSSLPSWIDGCVETSIWARNRGSQMLQEAKTLGMHPLALRLLALLLELKSIPGRMLKSGQESLIRILQPGLVAVEAARGTLIHQVTFEQEKPLSSKIQSYNIVAPTEWNFHPSGTLVQMLEGVRVDKDRLRPLVEKLILAVDPCVAYQVSINQDAG